MNPARTGRGRRARAGRVHRLQHLHLLVADRLGAEVDRRLHRGQRDELQQVVLEDVADRARLLVELGAALDPERLRDRDLDVVDELAVPDRLEDPVREPQREQVLDRLLAEIVVDPEDLVFLEVLLQLRVQLARGRQVAAERLLAISRTQPFLERCVPIRRARVRTTSGGTAR